MMMNENIFRICGGLLLSVVMFSRIALCAANETHVGSVSELEAALAKAKPGDVLVLQDGTYDQACQLSAKGTNANPIIVRPQSLGGVVFRQPVSIQAEFLSFVGFRFSDHGALSVRQSHGCRISRCHMNNLQPPKWLTVDAQSRQIEIDHCLFENKENNRTKTNGCQMVQFQLSNTGEAHHIHHNHFRDVPKGGSGNGFETLQLISRGNPRDPGKGNTGNVIENNLFERCDGEAEIISVKSNGNLIRGNTFRACDGAVVLRHGHANIVSGNWFIGNDKPGSGGVRLQGQDQVVINNYFERLAGFGVAMMSGTDDQFYVRVERALVAHNTFVNCARAFFIGLKHSRYPQGTFPRECTILNNLLHQDAEGSLVEFVNKEEPELWNWSGNFVQGTAGIPARDGLMVGASGLEKGDTGLRLPTAGTPSAPLPKGLSPLLNADIAGTPRPDTATVGAVQFTGKPLRKGPLNAADVGPAALAFP